MSLEKYHEKRNFNDTKEPKGIVQSSEKGLIFVIQKHAASHLHYDFRLEMDGVLKSWAVPKGPSLNPEIKRLAVRVEDHPYSYKDFEGVIPDGNYGAGNVIVWDNGTYIPKDKFEGNPEQKLAEDLQKGRLSFIMKGKKLKGEFSLVKLKGKEENAWLLIKKEDKYATTDDILEKDKSVISKRTLESIQNEKLEKIAVKKSTSKNGKVENTEQLTFQQPMFAETVKMPFDNTDWIYECKYDGYRIIGVKNNKEANLFSRNQVSYTENFKSITTELMKLQHNAVIDGEIVIEDSEGKSDFQMLQNYTKTKKGVLKYYVFDILNLDGNDTTQLSLIERKKLVKLLLKKLNSTTIRYAEHSEQSGTQFFQVALKKNWEGIMAKKANSNYYTGRRSDEWLKIKISQQEEAIIIGITEPKNSRSYFGAVLLGQYQGTTLKFIGKCGSGFTEETLKELYKKFNPLFTNKPPISEKILPQDTIQWITPKFVCQVKFTEWTKSKHLRHPVYLGLRSDKEYKEVTAVSIINQEGDTTNNIQKPNEVTLKVGKVTLQLTNQNKIYFPEDGITKGDIVNYYSQVANYILPYIKNRPQSMNRFPNGINGKNFYHKDVDVESIPKWTTTAKISSEADGAEIEYLICNNKQTLLYMANLGCIEINPWNSTLNKINQPDWVVIDIDPSTENFQEVVTTALVVKEIMDELDTKCYCKTSGATGLHVYIPLAAKYDYNTVKIFAEIIASEVLSRLPEITTMERSIKKRNNKIYLDFLQNRKGQTLAAPYSVRPKKGATVSTPLEWSEVNESLSPSQFTIYNTLDRLKEKGDLWKPVLGKGADINKIIKRLEAK